MKVINTHSTPSWRDIQHITHFSERTVQMQLSKLVKEGVLVKRRRLDDTRRTYYQVLSD